MAIRSVRIMLCMGSLKWVMLPRWPISAHRIITKGRIDCGNRTRDAGVILVWSWTSRFFMQPQADSWIAVSRSNQDTFASGFLQQICTSFQNLKIQKSLKNDQKWLYGPFLVSQLMSTIFCCRWVLSHLIPFVTHHVSVVRHADSNPAVFLVRRNDELHDLGVRFDFERHPVGAVSPGCANTAQGEFWKKEVSSKRRSQTSTLFSPKQKLP